MAGKRRTLKRSTAPLEPLLEETDSGQNSSQAAEAPLKDLQAEVEAPQFDENEKENSRADNRASLKVVSRKVVTKLEVEATKKKSVNEKVALILSDYPDLLEKACKNEKGQVLKILSLYWNFVPRDFVKQYMTVIVDTLSRDFVVGVRLAVYEGMRYIIGVPACLNAAEHALKCITLNGINDKNERVRVAAFEMLKMLKGHRYIRFFDIVPMEEVLARLQVETSESVRREIVPLIFKSFFPDRDRADLSERMRRIAFLIKHGRICALTFHRLLFPLALVTVKEAVEHIQYMTILIYRSFSKGLSADATIDGSMRLDDTIATLSGPSQEITVPDENNETWKRNEVFLECIVVMWMSMRKVITANYVFCADVFLCDLGASRSEIRH
ncbi:unnamed protein product [Nippostrongylus brasiliensis]|uniref:Condensin-2 complex subunit G2 (inferred by orthology to a human protein) n=1 Tax=Nippostrongylus brasiliensis TaxID=27835 RepID=A0A0N4YF59_NIPBR|nr:unnamed protein product [Nippostrongylus brasiliensis]